MKATKKNLPIDGGALYDALGLKLVLLRLNQEGYDLQVDDVHGDFHKLVLTCKSSRNRYLITDIGHNDLPPEFTD